MKYRSVFLAVIFILLIGINPARATFSIVAVDTVNNVVGGAGASCIDNAQIITDVVKGVGAAHTQAWYNAENQSNLHARLVAGWTPQDILDWLYVNDAGNDPEFRQYGIVTLAGGGTSAAFTGTANSNYKGHRTGPGYSIQGNILLGPEILDSMEYAFLNTDGPLEEKLMAALMAANVPGADSRCFSCDKPAISAFIRVYRPDDGSVPYLWRVVTDTDCPQNPIDSLIILFDAWKELKLADPDISTISIDPDILPASGDDSSLITVTPLNYDGATPIDGVEVTMSNSGGGTLTSATDNGDGTFSAYITAPTDFGTDIISAFATAGGETVELTEHPEITYFRCGDANADNTINILDITFVIAFLYQEGTPPIPPERADANGDGTTNIIDITYTIAHLYQGGPAPVCP